MRKILMLAAALAVALPTTAAGQRFGGPPPAQPGGDGPLDALTYRYVGPVGNRVSAVTGVPGDANVYYFGAASGCQWTGLRMKRHSFSPNSPFE